MDGRNLGVGQMAPWIGLKYQWFWKKPWFWQKTFWSQFHIRSLSIGGRGTDFGEADVLNALQVKLMFGLVVGWAWALVEKSLLLRGRNLGLNKRRFILGGKNLGSERTLLGFHRSKHYLAGKSPCLVEEVLVYAERTFIWAERASAMVKELVGKAFGRRIFSLGGRSLHMDRRNLGIGWSTTSLAEFSFNL